MLHWNSNFKSNSQRVNFNILGSSKEWAGRDNHYKIEGENNKNSHRYGKRYLECLESTCCYSADAVLRIGAMLHRDRQYTTSITLEERIMPLLYAVPL